MTEQKKIGRPTKYDPAFCEIAIELGRKGKSRESIAANLGVSWSTLLGWTESHPEFQEALENAKILEMDYWEELGSQHIVEVPGGPKLNTGVWNKSMSARFPHKWRDNSKMEVVGKDNGAIQVDVVHDFSQGLLNDLLATRQDDADKE
jgi:hypothetical protein